MPTEPALGICGLTRMPGWSRWIRRCICVMSVGILGSMSIWPPTTSVRRLAGWSVLFQVEAQSRQFAVWHQDQLVKLLPVPRLGRKGAGPGRLSAVHPARGVGCSATCFCPSIQERPTAASLGGGRLISSFTRQLSQALALHASNVRESCGLPASERDRGSRSNLLRGQPLRLIAHACSSHTAFFLSSLSFSRFTLSRFDEPTHLAVTMTESHTRCASRGKIGEGQ